MKHKIRQKRHLLSDAGRKIDVAHGLHFQNSPSPRLQPFLNVL